MAEKLEVSQSLRGAFIITESVIRKICDHISQATNAPVNVSIKLKGDRTISSPDPQLVLSDSSLSRYAIETIKISSNNYESRNSTYLTINYSNTRPILMQIEGDRHYVLGIEDTLKNELNGVKSSLSWLLYTQQKTVDIGFAFTVISASIFSVLIASIVFPEKFVEYFPAYTLPSVAAFFFFITSFLPYVIPGVSFNFGKGKSAMEIRSSFFKIVIGGVILGVFVNVLSNFFTIKLFP
ncbi:hypothetical protein [Brucella intermedia]|uniref:hypothetical protein n=1 Tax=Brucella intermedia TaxID=94625 RepID=UPI002361BF93|nr:hypothetical protein [Brucella intermedia]